MAAITIHFLTLLPRISDQDFFSRFLIRISDNDFCSGFLFRISVQDFCSRFLLRSSQRSSETQQKLKCGGVWGLCSVQTLFLSARLVKIWKSCAGLVNSSDFSTGIGKCLLQVTFQRDMCFTPKFES